MPDRATSSASLRVSATVLLVVASSALTLWAFWPTLCEMATKWITDPQYTHGYLVPVFSFYLLWTRRGRLTGAELVPSWWGLVPLAVAGALRYAATFNYEYLDGVALVVTVAGFFLLAGGMKALEWAWPAVAFLMFMIPLPYQIETGIARPLQHVATVSSTYFMQTIGLPAIAEGNVIALNSGRIEVEQACSGLSMLLIFFALATAMAVLIRRPLLDRLIILVSAVPIAIIANVARVTATALAQEAFGPEAAHKIFHDWAGWLMMPFALALLWLELGLLSLLFREEDVQKDVPLSFDHPLDSVPNLPKKDRVSRAGSQSGPTSEPPVNPPSPPIASVAPIGSAGS